jgi:hypothetical protein
MRVAVAPAAEYELRRGLFDMLGSKLDLSFEPHTPSGYEGLGGLIALSGGADAARGASERGISCYEVNLSQPISLGAPSAITFSSSIAVHGAFRNKTLADSSLKHFSRVPDSFECLANVGGQPVWAVEQHVTSQRHCVGVDVPAFKQGEFFHTYFREVRWFSMVPFCGRCLDRTAGRAPNHAPVSSLTIRIFIIEVTAISISKNWRITPQLTTTTRP